MRGKGALICVAAVLAGGGATAAAEVATSGTDKEILRFTARSPVRLDSQDAVYIRLRCASHCTVRFSGNGYVRKRGRMVLAPGTRVSGEYELVGGRWHRRALYASDRELDLMRRYGSVTYRVTASTPGPSRRTYRVRRTIVIRPPL